MRFMQVSFLFPEPSRWLFLALLGLALPALAADPDLRFTQVSDRAGIVDIANAGDGSDRLFLVEQTGRIFIHDHGADIATPFLDIRNKVMSGGGEQGLLSLAFAPNYGSSGYFFVWYTDLGGDMVLCRFRVGSNPNVADPATETLILKVEQPFSNHNGGRLRFAPDGMLYLGIGDGGGSFDPNDVAQDGASMLGKLIRIDVDPAHGTYATPSDNPFVDDDEVLDEIWALGLRNPWRIAFDRGTGDLYIADVGQNEFEEINFQPAGSSGGENYGWDIMEASQCTGGNSCDTSGFTLPVAEYGHGFGCSVTGGEVYRGNAYPVMEGVYFFGDYCSGNIWGLSRVGSQWNTVLLADTAYAVSTFGLGEDGSVYLASHSGGVYLLSDGDPVPEAMRINAGINDAWYNPETNGQGFLMTAFPEAEILFLAWFTYDVERPPQDVTAMLGEPGHRWLTAQGPYDGDTALLDINVSSGGVFDSAMPAVGPPEQDGTMTITWSGCNSAVLSYAITSLGIAGEIPLQRIALDNVALCRSLQ
jgi:glucose/arabinose dehydrogenase